MVCSTAVLLADYSALCSVARLAVKLAQHWAGSSAATLDVLQAGLTVGPTADLMVGTTVDLPVAPKADLSDAQPAALRAANSAGWWAVQWA